MSACGRPLVSPGSLSKQQVLDKFLDACAGPVYVDARSLANGGGSVEVNLAGNWREMHKEDENGQVHPHDHIAVKAFHQFCCLPVKRALMKRHGLASHWSCTHVGYYSPLRYLVMPSPPKKPASSLDLNPALWSSDGVHPPVDDLKNEPLTAPAIRARRKKFGMKSAEAGKEPPRIHELDVWPLVVNNGFRNTADYTFAHKDLIAFAKKHCSHEMHKFLFKNRARLPLLINDIWEWEHVDSDLVTARRSRLEALHHAAQSPCDCNGLWLQHVAVSFTSNRIAVRELCTDIYQLLADGRAESTPVIVLAGVRGGEGKSFFLKALLPVFGVEHVFTSPAPGNFPMVNLPGKKVMIFSCLAIQYEYYVLL